MAVLKELNLTVSTLGRCGSLERTDFNSFYFVRVWQVLKELILTVSTLGRRVKKIGKGGWLKILDLTVSTLEGMAVLKELILTFLLWEGMAVLKELTDFNRFYFGRVWWS